MIYITIKLPPSNKGRNKRGICAHKRTKLAKRQRRQYVPGFTPQLRSSTPSHD